jgi:nucleotide-binding universal stress UspA family protein
MKPEQPQEPPRGRIVVGTDGSQASAAAVRWALEAAEQTGAWLDVVLVWSAVIDFGWLGAEPLHGWVAQPASDGHALLDSLVTEVCGGSPPASVRTFVIEGDPAQCLLEHATGADVLVLADRGAGGFLGLRLGSVVSACAAHATCPVLIVPATHDGPPPGLLEPRTALPRYVPAPPARITTGASR